MTALIELTLIGLAVLVVIAIAIGVNDTTQGPAWRRIAAERRASWARRQQLHGYHGPVDAWADEDSD